MSEIEPNIPLLRKMVEWAEGEAAKPEIDSEWNQKRWWSPPSATAATLLRYNSLPGKGWVSSLSALAPHCGTAYCIAGKVGEMHGYDFKDAVAKNLPHIAEFARDELGLTEEQADALFHSGNTAHDVRRIAEKIAGEAL